MKTFIDVATNRSFTVAAELNGLTRLQASRHVQLLESWLNQRLLHRTTRQVSLTHAGQEALAHFQSILGQVSELESVAQEQALELSGNLRIATPIGFAHTQLLKVIEQFLALHPQVTIDVVASDSINDLVSDQIDIALRFTVQPEDLLIARKLLPLASRLCASPDYVAKHGSPTHPNELATHNCLVHMSSTTWQFVDGGDTLHIPIRGNLKANSMEMLLNAALGGLGIVYAPSDLADDLIAKGKLINLLAAHTGREFWLWAVYLSRSYQTPRVRRFIDYMAEELTMS